MRVITHEYIPAEIDGELFINDVAIKNSLTLLSNKKGGSFKIIGDPVTFISDSDVHVLELLYCSDTEFDDRLIEGTLIIKEIEHELEEK